MTGEKELTRDIMMGYHNVHGNKARIHEQVTYLARERVVKHHTDCAGKRALPFLPLKYTESNEYLKIPAYITTEDQLWAYVEEKSLSGCVTIAEERERTADET